MRRISAGATGGRAFYLLLAIVVLSAQGLSQQTIRVDVNLVSVFATVHDEKGQFVTGLGRDDFHLFEDGIRQEIRTFESGNNIQSSVGLLVDTSGSMVDVLPFMRSGIRDFTKSLPAAHEFFVVSFGASPRLVHTSTQGQRRLEDSLDQLRAYGTSFLFNALLYSNDKILASERPRKALIVFTDGIFTDEKNVSSPYTRVLAEAQRSSVLIYFIAMGPRIIVDTNTVESLADITGGRPFYVTKNDSIVAALDEIRAELSSQYFLGYYAMPKSGLHQIRVEVPERKVKVRARTRYSVR